MTSRMSKAVLFVAASWIAAVGPAAARESSFASAERLLTLLGTFAADAPSLSRATLRDDETGRTFVVGIGDLIEDRAVVIRIERGRVVLRENDRPRELILAGQPFAASSSEGERAIRNSVPGVHAVPVFEEAQLVGVQFSLVQFGTHLAEIGLENGDVITEFNESPIDSPAKCEQLMQELSEADAVHAVHLVGYRADGSERVWNYVREDG